MARQLAADGADVIDVGCEPDGPWTGVADAVRALRDDGHRVSIDSLDPREIEPAVHAGAELVLSVNSSNRAAARDWGCEVVVVPDDPRTLAGLDETVDELAAAGVRLRIDPVLEPIGFGFAASLGRYLQVRERYPDAEMMMGIGNLTELTDADSAAINVVLLGFCQELGIRSVLTTQVINWARSSVRECDLARRLVYHSVRHRVLPKHLEPRLVMLRDPAVLEPSASELERLSREIKDANYRVFVAGGEVHVVSHELHLHDADPFALFEQLRHARARRRTAQEPRCRPRVLSRLRNVQGGDGAHARQAIPAGRTVQLGALYPARATALSPRATSRPRRRRDIMKPIADFQNGLPLVERLESATRRMSRLSRLADLPHVVFFDSAMRHPQLGRYSFVAADPVEWLAVPADGSDALSTLYRAFVAVARRNHGPDLPPFQGGWAGMFGYELARSLESIPRRGNRRISSFPRWPSACTTSWSRSITSSETPG